MPMYGVRSPDGGIVWFGGPHRARAYLYYLIVTEQVPSDTDDEVIRGYYIRSAPPRLP